MNAKVERIWINKVGVNGAIELRVDFNNNRHYAAMIRPPQGADEFVDAMHLLSSRFSQDRDLLAKGEGV